MIALSLCMASLFSPQPLHASDGPEVRYGPAPDWVVPIGVPATAGVSSELLHDGVADLLSDTQVRVGFGPQVAFNRYVSQVIEPSGVSAVGRIQIEFAASYQSLTLHWVRRIRDGVVQERLDPAKVRLIQQEEDLDLNLYYQSATALILLDDIRVGDRVDYAFSITGANPIFGGRYQDWHYLEWWYPFGRIHTRVIAPADRPLHFEPHNTDQLPVVTRYDDVLEYVWAGDAIAARVNEDTTPSGYDPLAAHQVSEFGSWAEVARWASDTFDTDDTPDSSETAQTDDTAAKSEVRSLAARIAREFESDEERIIGALRFVQDEVRYLGLEIGVNAYEPHPPELTLERRYGDCKDKSSLYVALLDELGIEAHVALVHTELGPRVAELHPTAGAFDHAIVRVKHAGHDYWLDPTASYDRGPLQDEEWPDYGFALVVDPGGQALTKVLPSRAALSPAKLVHRYRTTDYEEPSELDVTSTYRGDRADRFRSWAASMPRDAIERQYQNYYARDLKGIELAAPLAIEDDEETNTIVVRERYHVPDLWQWDDELERFVATFIARELRDELSSPETVQRSHPLGFSHPVDTLLEITIEAPEEMRVRELEERIVGPAFELDYAVEQLSHGVTLSYHYRSTSDRIETKDVEDHLEAVDEMWGTTEYWLGSSTPGAAIGGRGRAGDDLGNGLFAGRSQPGPILTMALAVFAWLYGFWPWWSLRLGLAAFRAGRVGRALTRLRRGQRLTLPWTALHRRHGLVSAVVLGWVGRNDEARGMAAALSRMSLGSPATDRVVAAAWAWRAILLVDTEPERAFACAERAVGLARTLAGDDGFAVRSCALASRATVLARLHRIDEARRDVEEAGSHDAARTGAVSHTSWLTMLPLIANADTAELGIALADDDAPGALRKSRALLERAQQDWPERHPVVVALQLGHAEVLWKSGDRDAARRTLETVRAALPTAVADESPLHARAARLALAIEARAEA